MAGSNQISVAAINTALTGQNNYMGAIVKQLETYIYQWVNNCPDVATMSTAGLVSVADQQQVLQHQANVLTLVNCVYGSMSAPNTHNMLNDIAKAQGVTP